MDISIFDFKISLLIFDISIHLISKTLYWCFDNLVLERVDKLMSTLKKGSMLWPGKLDHEHHYLFHHLLSISSSTNSIHCNLVIIVHVATIINKNGQSKMVKKSSWIGYRHLHSSFNGERRSKVSNNGGQKFSTMEVIQLSKFFGSHWTLLVHWCNPKWDTDEWPSPSKCRFHKNVDSLKFCEVF